MLPMDIQEYTSIEDYEYWEEIDYLLDQELGILPDPDDTYVPTAEEDDEYARG